MLLVPLIFVLGHRGQATRAPFQPFQAFQSMVVVSDWDEKPPSKVMVDRVDAIGFKEGIFNVLGRYYLVIDKERHGTLISRRTRDLMPLFGAEIVLRALAAGNQTDEPSRIADLGDEARAYLNDRVAEILPANAIPGQLAPENALYRVQRTNELIIDYAGGTVTLNSMFRSGPLLSREQMKAETARMKANGFNVLPNVDANVKKSIENFEATGALRALRFSIAKGSPGSGSSEIPVIGAAAAYRQLADWQRKRNELAMTELTTVFLSRSKFPYGPFVAGVKLADLAPEETLMMRSYLNSVGELGKEAKVDADAVIATGRITSTTPRVSVLISVGGIFASIKLYP